MDTDSQRYDVKGHGNIFGDRSHSQVTNVNVDTEHIRQLTNKLDDTTNVISSLADRLDGQIVPPKRDWTAYTILFVFVIFCVSVISSPLWIYPFVSDSGDAQNFILTVSSSMSGVTGLLGVLVGNRMKLSRL